jgi:hypothetical protein
LKYLRVSSGADRHLSEPHRIVARGHLVYHTAAYFGILSYFATHRSFLLTRRYTYTYVGGKEIWWGLFGARDLKV